MALGLARPGASQGLDLQFVNPHRHPLLTTRLTTGIVADLTRGAGGCYRSCDFRSFTMHAVSYPVVSRSATLTEYGVPVTPRMSTRRLPGNHDDCRGTRLTLRLGGRAHRFDGRFGT